MMSCIYKAWSKCYSRGVTGSVQSWSYGEEDSSLPGQMSPLTTMIYYYVKFRGCTESLLICSTLQTLLETKLWCCLYLLLM
jgi:hypothetical protein